MSSPRRWRSARGLAVAVAFVVTAPLQAQIIGEGVPLKGQINDTALITMTVKERPLEDVLDGIRKKVGVSLVALPGTDGLVTITLREIPWREALDLIAENAGCVVTQASARVYRVEQPQRVTMAFTQEDIKKVIEAIAKAGNANIIVSERVTGLVTMVLHDRPWRDALEAVVKTNGFHLIEEDRGILRVVDDQGLSTHLERRLFQLKYLRPKDTYVARIDTLYAEGNTTAAENDPAKDFPMLGALRQMLSKDGKLDYLEPQNAIVVLDTRPVLDEVAGFIDRLDIEPIQVFIDVKFVQTAMVNSSEFALGFDRGLSAQLTGAARTSRLPFNLGKGSLADRLLPGPRPSTDPSIIPISAVAPGILDFSATSLAVRLLKTDSEAKIVQRPSLVTLNDKPATIFVGETIRYAQAEATAAQSGGLQLEVKEADNSPVQTGFQLMVIPHVVPGTNKVMMVVVPEAETLTGTSDPNLPGFERFEVGAGTDGLGVISLPRIGQQTIVTSMILENGQTGVVGGLMQSNVLDDTSKVPFLGDLPWLGWLFRNENKRDEKRGLMVFVTPWIVRGSENQDEDVQRTIEALEERAIIEWESMAGMFEDDEAEG